MYGFNLGQIDGLNYVEYQTLDVTVDGVEDRLKIQAISDMGVGWLGEQLRFAMTLVNGNAILIAIAYDETNVGETHNILVTAETADIGLSEALQPFYVIYPNEFSQKIQDDANAKLSGDILSQAATFLFEYNDENATSNYNNIMYEQIQYAASHPERIAYVGSYGIIRRQRQPGYYSIDIAPQEMSLSPSCLGWLNITIYSDQPGKLFCRTIAMPIINTYS